MTKVVVGLFVLCKNMWDSQSGGEEVLKEIPYLSIAAI
jgi:hypothetical protein